MADEIKQTLGLDASQALEQLNLLDQGFAKMAQTLQNLPSTFSSFNQSAGKTVSALVQIATRANAAFDALSKLNNVKAPPTVSGGGLPAVGGGGAGLLTGNAAAAAMNQLLAQTQSQSAAAANGLTNMGNAATNAFSAGARGGAGFALSLETITRVIGTQIIVRALNSIRSAVEGSFEGFIEFNRHIAEIGTISKDQNVDQLSASVRQLSDDFNAPILDVAKGKYEALSNGFDSAAESTKIVTAALKFAKVGIASTAESVDLISTSLNAYGKSADEAETISAKLFKTIELGRVVGSELANAFGRVAPIGKEIGATEDELLAAFSSITIGGVKASEAATQIRATLTGLLKPSQDTAEALHKLGFESGEQLVGAKGFKGALDALIGTTNGSTTAIAKLFPNVRALNGVLRETGTGATIFEDHLKEIQKTSQEVLSKKFELIKASDAARIEADINKIKNFFTVDLGSALVSATATMANYIGGVDTLISLFRNFAGPIGATIAAITGYQVVMLGATVATRIFSAAALEASVATLALRAGLTGVIAALAIYAGINFVSDRLTAAIRAPQEEAEAATAALLQDQKDKIAAQGTLDKLAVSEKTKVLHEAVAVIRAGYFAAVEVAKKANVELLQEDKATFDKIIAGREKFAQDLKHAAQTAENDVIASKKRSVDLQGQLQDRQFNAQLRGANDLTKFFRERQRAEELASQASSLLGKANKPEDQELATKAFQRAEAMAQQAASSAEASGNLTAQVGAERTLQGIIQQKIAAEQKFQALRSAAAQKLEAEAAIEEKRVTNLKQLSKDFLQKANLFDDKGQKLDSTTIKSNVAEARQILEKFKKEAFGDATKFKLDDLFSFDKLEQRLNGAVTPSEIKNLSVSADTLDSIVASVQSAFDKTNIIFKIAPDPKALEGLNREDAIRTTDEQLNGADENAKKQIDATNARAGIEKEIEASISNQTALLNTQKGGLETFLTALQKFSTAGGGSGAIEQGRDVLRSLREEALRLSKDKNTTAEQINKLGELFRATESANKSNTLVGSTNGALNTDLQRAREEYDTLKLIFAKRQEIRNQAAQPGIEAAATKAARESALKQLESATQAVQAERDAAAAAAASKTSNDGTKSAAEGAKSALGQGATNSAAIAANAAAAAKSLAAAAQSARDIGAAGSAKTKAFGGQMSHFASGGWAKALALAAGGAAKGTDNIPALLSQDEVVTNAMSSRKFFPQLQQINAGIPPSMNSSPSGDTFHIGDINVNGSNDPKATAREVLNLIRREQRRGTGSSLR